MIRGVSSVIDYRLEPLELLLPRTLGIRNSTQNQGENAPLEAGPGQLLLESKIGRQLSKAVSRGKSRGFSVQAESAQGNNMGRSQSILGGKNNLPTTLLRE